jgi:hypothetical protein
MLLAFIESLSNAVAFALAAHNANVSLFTHDLNAAFNVAHVKADDS